MPSFNSWVLIAIDFLPSFAFGLLTFFTYVILGFSFEPAFLKAFATACFMALEDIVAFETESTFTLCDCNIEPIIEEARLKYCGVSPWEIILKSCSFPFSTITLTVNTPPYPLADASYFPSFNFPLSTFVGLGASFFELEAIFLICSLNPAFKRAFLTAVLIASEVIVAPEIESTFAFP